MSGCQPLQVDNRQKSERGSECRLLRRFFINSLDMPITFAYNRTTEQAQIYLMRGSKMEERFTSTQECFLCALDPHHYCTVRQLEGRVVAALEYTLNGEKTPIIVIDTGTARVEIHLTHYYRKFVG